jgi:hypothetical protein
MRSDIVARMEATAKTGRWVRLIGDSVRNLETLRAAYDMPRREQVLEYLITQGVEGLKGAEGVSSAAAN